ncbi:ficolin-2-like [Littorina saxatilis]|uniref:Fibrinogen C-terminal domain-containing protein n=1 Tax=Littorina saxatilis TaxID=31220 RepID=A0AAN9APP9_9CAEN
MTALIERGVVALLLLSVLHAASSLSAPARLDVDDDDVRLSPRETSQGEPVQANKDQALQTLQLRKRESKNKKGRTCYSTCSAVQKHSCVDWLNYNKGSGIRTVYVSGEPITVYCDQTTDNGGWIVFQRRIDASTDFFRNWTDYRNGFGDMERNFWLGLDKLHSLTTSQKYELRVDLHMWNSTKGHAIYSGFYVEGVGHNFALQYDKFTGGNAGDSLWHQRGQQFSTKDRDHDKSGLNCAQYFHGAWWYKGCHVSNLNGEYKTSSSAPSKDGMNWDTFGGVNTYSMQFTEMKIRPI